MVRIQQSENWSPRVKPVQGNLTPTTRATWISWGNTRYNTKITDTDLVDITSITIVGWTLITCDTILYTCDTIELTADIVLLWWNEELTPLEAEWWNLTNVLNKYWK